MTTTTSRSVLAGGRRSHLDGDPFAARQGCDQDHLPDKLVRPGGAWRLLSGEGNRAI
jgi:hypothetical protein